ncbi:MAG: hypothetical protein N5P05_002145 [Chroococcopsis gigantea SAG 12.99]|jgi:hypothetical protein|nr:DUF4126 domain-containing protein [Chlorogloea purpurea SAG 13.99]MDV3000539.1 hypothetical protein [Chroococcopsis gigantea SAG 12.99]
MESLLSVNTVASLLLGISLSAACGLRLFLPFLMLSFAADIGHIGLPADLSWLSSDQALLMLGIASAVEIIGYYIPVIDNILDPIALPLATIAGTFVTASTLPEMNSIAQWTLAAIVGGGSAGLIKSTTSISRIGSTILSGGLGNFIISTLEWLGASGLVVLALTLPALAGVFTVALLLFIVYKVWPKITKRFFSTTSPS